MSYASIVVSLDTGPETGDRVRLAADLARRFEATLTGVAARRVPAPAAVNDFRDAEAIFAREEARLREELAQVRAAFEREAGEGVPTAWCSAAAHALAVLVQQARSADLVVVGRPGSGDADPGEMGVEPGPVLMEAGRPVLVVPPGIDRLRAARVVVAWKDRPEARRAVSGALPFITAADQVFVATAGAEARFEGAEDVAGHLARHGAHVTAHFLTCHARSAADEILRFAERQDADLVVMGAYGHSRLREWMFGGATHDALRTAPLCLLMSH
ncbi:universal stress protein [Methylobacterium sp. WSM2598]|uniref:universal stress protein n=1 Tax=Methylobacterium sp. WSM2598 TaxID=398261 RepID=UPI000365B6CD|nr:universal stress protein [Methylobacterium sp. WSM2598]